MRELPRPDGIAGDEEATEMIRYWIAHHEHHLSLNLGMYEDAEECAVNELYAWGNILADIAQHVANGLQQSHGWHFNESAKKLASHFIDAMATRAPGLEGKYLDDD
jgi:hypothetical protein